MPFEKSLPEWNKAGTEPPQSLKDSGWAANQKPPADYFNWFFNTVFLALQELQQRGYTQEEITQLISSAATTAQDNLTGHTSRKDNPHAVTKSQVGLGNVDNVQQATKSEFNTHNNDATRHITTDERNKWNAMLPSSSYTAADVLAKLKTVDGQGSGVDADLLDGYNSDYFAPANLAQMLKITNDNGGVTISVSNTTQDFLATIVSKGVGMNTFYCVGGAVNAPSSKSARGISYLSAANYGIVLAVDFSNTMFINYLDNGNWVGWSQIENTVGSQAKADAALSSAKSYADGKFLPSVNYNASDILSKLKTVDGPGSGLDADTLDGHDSSYFLPASAYSASDVLAKLKSVDGSGSGVDADLLDGHDSNYFAQSSLAQLLKITNDNGSPTIGISDTSQDFLAAIVAKGVGMNTFYCTGGAVNAPSKSIRGISFITDNSPRGLIIGIDYTGVMWTNYTDPNSGWTGWRTIADNTVAQMMKITSDNGGVTVSIPDTNTDLLAALSSAGIGMHTFYCPAGGLNNPVPAKNSPVRGIAHFTNGTATSASIGWVIAIDTSGNTYTNYLLSAGNWSGWIRSLSTADQSATWYNLPLSNGAQAWSSDVVPQYCKVGGVVYLRGAITNVSSTGLVLGTLPAGYRPSKTWNFIQNTSQKGGFGNSARWAIGADGTITLEYVSSDVLGSSVWLPLFTDFPIW